MLKRLLLLFCLSAVFSITVNAQGQKTISGIVSDASTGETLIGATVVETGTQNATITDIDGNYTLKLNGNKITISYVGYTPKEVTVTGSGTYDVKLSSSTDLDEVVVVGYGVQRKSDLTGAISSISSKDLRNQSASNVSGLLAGKAAGVQVSASSGQPGSAAIIRVRGLGTYNDNNPLYVVDGMFMDNINNLNPADIDRIEILKDASSLAIYGSRGSNGVIIISTKSGVVGKTEVSLDMSIGIKDNYKSIKMMDSDQYYNFIMKSFGHEADWNPSNPRGNAYNFSQLYKRGYNTDWWKEATQTAFNQNYNLSVRKGTENSRTSLSLGYYGEQGTIITTDFNRISARFSQEYDLNKNITVGVTVNLAKIKQKNANALPQFSQILSAEPFSPVINPLVDPSTENYQYNKYAPTEWTFNRNPIATLEIPNRYNDLFNVYGNVFASVKLFKGLTYRFQYSMERNNDKYHEFTPLFVNTFTPYTVSDKEGKATNTRPSLYESEARTFNQIIENRLNYVGQVGEHNFDLMAAVTYEPKVSESFGAYGAGAVGNDKDYEVLDSNLSSQNAGGSKTSSSMMSYLGRINYSFAGKYLLTANFRADGSSTFVTENRWGYFPSVSAGWRITNESFFKDLKVDSWLNDMKLRIGWGRNGNARIDQNAALTLVGTSKNDQWAFDGENFSQGYYLKYTGNKKLKWETSEQLNIGLDATLFNQANNLLNLNFDYYVKTTHNVLLPFTLPSFGGYTNAPFMNAGKIKNVGFDFGANYTNSMVKDLTLNFGLNLSTYKTTIKSLSIGDYELEYLGGNNGRSFLNGPFNKFWGYKQIGIFQTQEEIDNYVDAKGNKIQPQAAPGDFKFENIDNSDPLNDDDRTFIGDPNPDLIFGFNIGAQYKNVDISMSFQGTLGNDIWNSPKGALAGAGFQNAIAGAYADAWTKEGDNTTYPRMTSINPNDNFRGSSFYVEDGSYMRLQSLQIGYNLPAAICKQTKIFSSLRVFGSAQNLFTLTKYSGLDPDLGIDSPSGIGVDALRYPTPRTFLFGINAQF